MRCGICFLRYGREQQCTGVHAQDSPILLPMPVSPPMKLMSVWRTVSAKAHRERIEGAVIAGCPVGNYSVNVGLISYTVDQRVMWLFRWCGEEKDLPSCPWFCSECSSR